MQDTLDPELVKALASGQVNAAPQTQLDPEIVAALKGGQIKTDNVKIPAYATTALHNRLMPPTQRDPTLGEQASEAAKGFVRGAGIAAKTVLSPLDSFIDSMLGNQVSDEQRAADIQESPAQLAPNPDLKRGIGARVGEMAGNLAPIAITGGAGAIPILAEQGAVTGYYEAAGAGADEETRWKNALAQGGIQAFGAAAGGVAGKLANLPKFFAAVNADSGGALSKSLGDYVMQAGRVAAGGAQAGLVGTAQVAASEAVSDYLLKADPKDRKGIVDLLQTAVDEGGVPGFILGAAMDGVKLAVVKEHMAAQPKAGPLGEKTAGQPQAAPEGSVPVVEAAKAARQHEVTPEQQTAQEAPGSPQPQEAPQPAPIDYPAPYDTAEATPSEQPQSASAEAPPVGAPTEPTPPSSSQTADAPPTESERTNAHLRGMGAEADIPLLTPGEAPETIGIKRDALDKQLTALDLPPRQPGEPLSDEHVFGVAKQSIANDSAYASDLITRLGVSNEIPNEYEVAALGLETNRRWLEVERLEKAAESDPTPTKLTAVEDARKAYQAGDAIIARATSTSGRAFRLIGAMLKKDNSLAAWERRVRTNRGGEDLTPELRTQLKTEHAKYAELQNKLDEAIKTQQQVNADSALKEATLQAENALLRMKRESKNAPRQAKIAKSRARLDAIVQELATRGRNRTAGGIPIDPHDIALVGEAALRAAEVGYHEFAAWSEEMVSKVGEWVQPHLQAAWDAAQKLKREELAKGIKERLAGGEKLTETGRAVDQLVRNFAEEGITDLGAMVRAVHDVLHEADPNITMRDAHDAVTHYGQFKKLSADEVSANVRRIRGEGREIAKLADIAERKPPKVTGIEYPKAEERQRALSKQVTEGMKRLNIKTTDEATQIKSTLNSLKTRARNEISDLQYALDRGEKMIGREKIKLTDPELQSLRTQLQAKRTEYQAAFKGDTDLERVVSAKAVVEKSIADYEKRIAAGDIARKQGIPGPSSQELEMLKARRVALQAELETLRRVANFSGRIEDRNIAAIKARKAQVENANARAHERLFYAEHDPASALPTPRKVQPALAPELERTKADTEAQRQKVAAIAERERIKRLPLVQKIARTVVQLRRTFVLSSPSVVEKLAAAGVLRMGARTAQEMAGRLIPESARARMPHEGGANYEAQAWTRGVIDGAKEAWANLQNKSGARQLVYGKPEVMPRTPLEYLGSLHQALHQLPVQMEFTRQFEKGVAWAKAQGFNASDPLVLMRIGTDAYEYAQRETLLQENRLVKAVEQGLSVLERPNKQGKVSSVGIAGAAFVRVMLPVTTIPTNAVAEAFTYILGTEIGIPKIVQAYRSGIENLGPVEADAIGRLLKKGIVGKAAMAVAFLTYESLGGFYRGKRRRDEVPAGDARIAGVDIDQHLLHSPFLEAMQFAANLRHVTHQRKNNGVTDAELASALGLLKEAPYAREMVDVGRLLDSPNVSSAVGAEAASMLTPQALLWAARARDLDAHGNPIKRKATGFIGNMQAAIPGLRESLPRKQ